MTLQEVLLGFALAARRGSRLRGPCSTSRRRCAAPSTRCSSPRRRCRSSSSRRSSSSGSASGSAPKLAIIALICFFPITVNTLDGLRSVDPGPDQADAHARRDRWLRIFAGAEAPSALPYLFSGAKIAVAVAVIGAVFGEWAGSDAGLGHLMLQASAQLETARLFAAVVVLSVFAIGAVRAALAARAPRRVVGAGERLRRGVALPRVAARSRVLAPAAARSEERDAAAAAHGAVRPGARLLRQPRPRRDLHGARARLLRGRRARRRPAGPLRPVGADQAGRGGPGRPGDLLRARGAARPRRRGSTWSRSARSSTEPLTSLISLGEAGDRRRRATSRQDVATAGIPYQAAFLRRDPRARRGLNDRTTSSRSTSASTCCPADRGAGPTRCSAAFRNVEGVDLAAARRGPDGGPRRRARDPDLRRARPGRQRASASRTTRRRSASSSPRWSAARTTRPTTPARPRRRCSTRTRTSTRS